MAQQVKRDNCDLFIQIVAQHFGAVFAFGPAFSLGPRRRAEDFGFIVPVSVGEYGRFIWNERDILITSMRENRMSPNNRQRRAWAMERTFPAATMAYMEDELRRSKLDATDYTLDFSDMLPLPEGHWKEPWWLAGPGGLPDCPSLEFMVAIDPEGSWHPLEVPA